jgi:hypothetical protein
VQPQRLPPRRSRELSTRSRRRDNYPWCRRLQQATLRTGVIEELLHLCCRVRRGEASSRHTTVAGGARPLFDPEPVREHARNLLAKRQRHGAVGAAVSRSETWMNCRLVEKGHPVSRGRDSSNVLRMLAPIEGSIRLIGWSIRLA